MGRRIPAHYIQINKPANQRESKEECIRRILERDRQEELAEREWQREERQWKVEFNRWWEKRVEQCNRNSHIRRMRFAGTIAAHGEAVNSLTLQEWKAIMARYQYRCAYCQQRKPLTKDHIVPISKGGFHTHLNVIPACKSCNSRKQARPAFLYKPKLVPF
jgi:5-methylcytosine-specific restriction endonuclease McrA